MVFFASTINQRSDFKVLIQQNDILLFSLCGLNLTTNVHGTDQRSAVPFEEPFPSLWN
ncbi:hypothetical protein I4U23_005683 [Adineta vaga]|nr:hypothetical protein I4U23_005683 [Adineta vaga]